MSYTAQTTLTEDAPLILDATCSFRHRWPRYATIRMDIRPETKPDIVGDCTATKFPMAYFDAIYCDPPHMFSNAKAAAALKQAHKRSMNYYGSRTGTDRDMLTLYGFWNGREEWLIFATRSLVEFRRIIKPTGILHYKLTESDKMFSGDITDTALFQVISEKRTRSGSNYGNNKVVWLTMKPIAEPRLREGLA